MHVVCMCVWWGVGVGWMGGGGGGGLEKSLKSIRLTLSP